MSDENKIKRKFEKADRLAIENSITALAASRDGRKFLWWLLEIGNVGTQPFATNEFQTAFNCGALNVGNQILAKVIETNPEVYPTMMKENEDEREQRTNELNTYRAEHRGDRGYASE